MRITAVTQSFQSELRKLDTARKAENSQKFKGLQVDSSEISAGARRLSESKAQVETISTQVASQPEIRFDKVEEVQEKIKSGYYNSPEFIDKLADKLTQEFGAKGLG